MNVALIGNRFSKAITLVADVDVETDVLSKLAVKIELLIRLRVL